MVKNLLTTFEETDVDPEDIKLEITESVIMDDRQGITPVLEEIRSLGVQLAMDDFGTGLSSLSCLHRFPINVLKIDREFIGNLEHRIEYYRCDSSNRHARTHDGDQCGRGGDRNRRPDRSATGIRVRQRPRLLLLPAGCVPTKRRNTSSACTIND